MGKDYEKGLYSPELLEQQPRDISHHKCGSLFHPRNKRGYNCIDFCVWKSVRSSRIKRVISAQPLKYDEDFLTSPTLNAMIFSNWRDKKG